MQKFETLTKLKIFNNHLFIFTSTSTYLRFSIALPSSFSHLPIRIAPSFIRLSLICSRKSHRLLFVFSLSARATRTVFYSSFLYLPVRLAPSFVRLLFVFCSSFVRLLFVFCSSFVYLPVRLAPSFVYLPVVLRLSIVLRAHTLPSTIGIIGIIVLITDIVNISFSSP